MLSHLINDRAKSGNRPRNSDTRTVCILMIWVTGNRVDFPHIYIKNFRIFYTPPPNIFNFTVDELCSHQ